MIMTSFLNQLAGLIIDGKRNKGEPHKDEIVEEIGFSRSTIEHMKSIFELFDINGDGDICITELERVTKALGHTPPSPEEIQQIIIDFDEDGNEVIDFQEFLKMMKFHTQNNKEKPDEELRNAIKVFDKSGTGKLSDKAVIEILSQQGDERIPRDEAHQFLEFAKDLFKEDQLSIENLVELLRPEDEVSHSSDID